MLKFFAVFNILAIASYAGEGDSLSSAVAISVAGMRAQNERLKIITQNIANSEVTGANPNEDPYRRKQIIFKNVYDDNLKAVTVKVDRITPDKSDFILKYEPNHPAADANGYVKYPNINNVIESVDAKEAQRTFEANLSAMEIARANQSKIIDLMR
ncbi:flagellar basal body rod flgC [endosymbiont of Acanthamoeba sp. UWC8]|uniref:flagellar basal body rod protein FlgC n=1 Tax=endosymbiont of Acanthamoeba sp. UWC8 TaxID=86106 RepID=UPI0004D1A624|nr:flagellar basal body rod protein FlgC [endosymbiont of Acanthamoeba sp. UWC8]AIF81546.1 flagellar basal body rod flgC [endosymbiont of Acanthamoeba sp. UWC8]